MKNRIIAMITALILILMSGVLCARCSGEQESSTEQPEETKAATADETAAATAPAATETPDEPTSPLEKAKTAAIDELSDRLAETQKYPGKSNVMLRSYDTDQKELANTAYTYDNALTAMAFLSEDRRSDAEELLDAFEYAVENDRFKSGRIRNAYAADMIYWNEDGRKSVKLPGWYNGSEWCEDAQQVGSGTGNTSYAALALLQYDKKYDTDRYLDTAKALMDWVISDCSDSSDGFTAGVNGWPEEYGKAQILTYKSTEHNIDAYAAFRQLYEATGDEKYQKAADSALSFIRSMYNEEGGYFYTGTGDDGVTPNTDVIVLDAQVWSALAMGDEFKPYERALGMVEQMKTEEGGYPFCRDNQNGGFWCEGTAFTALMYKLRADEDGFNDAMDVLCDTQLDNGLFPAATVDNLSTGMYLPDGSSWEYRQDPHIAPAAWFVMAANGFNPYAF
ncbi:MAG: hypothetical protein IJH40_07440 [Ruminococcus sp.]|uniref:hypothetical protein n=1 Tax=Ruminococcus sp. TaxID=41978 RepID=UPI002872C4FB|nr:hypothetical protein [Ruminococcus sp.]MBQ3285459.1 hypothetical protein [Ruminococcus sp.]